MEVSSLIDFYTLNGIVETHENITVYNAIGKAANRMYNVSRIPKDLAKSTTRNPFSMLLSLKSEFLVNCVDVFEDSKTFYAAYELPNGTPLIETIHTGSRIKEERAAYILNQLLQAVKYLHQSGFGNIQINPQTIFVTPNDDVTITDYSFLANIPYNERLQTRPEILENAPPEFFKSGSYVASQANVWSIGVIAYILVTGSHPFKTNTHSYNQSEYIIKESILQQIQIPSYISTSAHNFIQRSLEIEPTRRFSIDQCIGHLWISKQSKKMVKVSSFNSFNSLQFDDKNIFKSNGLSTLSPTTKNSPTRFSSSNLSSLSLFSNMRPPSEFDF
ncbi:CAMK family protein kinase [Trichomonas vaginalis G3]|uniref:CAMK family protein kinase n=1 Tax=Trichomonas vaginalis (strain ATCC PRA-98 / G3) TaxID=412133 RepID=A2EFY3_TRIV3|nr:protein serine/threonine kinase protein [Trichomonas vaginalis G3]EAY08439.1 CAMK family protein kinase [Trichomonas vaginalis G3]KAI5518129.1 protein serine/threonine kinase protein [Trichomonas vaginalis G3]|eukprot:XP_001320662.1 CAMK family protein kinase [Trichomonas vaginalis G3]